MNKKEDKQT